MLLPAAILLGSLEMLLSTAGVQPVTQLRDPYVGFSSQVPLMEEIRDKAGLTVVRTAGSKRVWFNDQSFPKEKPPTTTRIFCVGGSTTYGRPYFDLTSYSGWMRELLPVADPSRNWEVINAGGISYASYRVAAVMEELSQYQPDLFVVYSANNEFLERRTYAGMFQQPSLLVNIQAVFANTRTYALLDKIVRPAPQELLPAEVDERLNHTIGPADYTRDLEWQNNVIRHYQVNLRRMVAIAKRAGARIVFVTPATNEKDCSPFKSEPSPVLSAETRTRFFELTHQATTAHETGRVRDAVDLFQEALRIDPQYADVHFQLGKSLMELQAFDAALSSFQQAIEEDVCSLRATAAVVKELRLVASELHIPVIEFQQLLRDQCRQELGHACLGSEYFLDHVHPDIETHRQLAMWIIDGLQTAGLVGGARLTLPELTAQIERVKAEILNRIDVSTHGVALRNLAKVLHWAGKFAEAAPRARDGLELLPNDAESRFVLADCLKNIGDSAGAFQQYELLFEQPEIYGRALLPYGEILVEHQRYEQAKVYLLLAILHRPDNAYAYFVLGKAHLGLGETPFAFECFQKANELFPGDPLTEQLLQHASATLQTTQ